MARRGLFWAAGLLFLVSACAPVPEPVPAPPVLGLERTDFAGLSGWGADDQAQALAAFRRTCATFDRMPDDRDLGVAGTIAHWRGPCAALPAPDVTASSARSFFEHWFTPYLARDESRGRAGEKGLFTGYFEPLLRGDRAPGGPFTVPLYRAPPELVSVDLGRFRDELAGQRIAGTVERGRLVPFADRAAIEGGALSGRGLEFLWVDDAVDAFFLHIQGSGRVMLPDGTTVRVGYAGVNGHLYTAIGRELIAMGEIAREDVSLQTIRAWLRANPDQARAMMWRNRSFVFFEEQKGEGPLGSLGVPLTAGRSLAVDRVFVPLGIPVWLETTDPVETDRPIRRLMVAQDTGGAIKGPVRGDVFWGAGEAAETRAGLMKQDGRYFLLLPKGVKIP